MRAVSIVGSGLALFVSCAQQARNRPIDRTAASATGTHDAPLREAVAADAAAAIAAGRLPSGYRDWRLISVAREEGNHDDIRAVLGNDVAIHAYREGTRPFPDGTIIARLAWSYVASEENNKAFGNAQSFVAGAPKNGVQFMVKDTTKYASTGGWGYSQFDDGKPLIHQAALRSCFDCHQMFENRDFVFTHYAP